jgi:hypothetical protein
METREMMKNVYGNQCMSRTHCCEWFKRFNPIMSYLNPYSVDSGIRFKSPNNTESTVALRPEVI